MFRISLLGPQGCGKGTQADLLSLHLHLPVITMSALLKARVALGGPDAEALDATMKAGKLVAPEITLELLCERVAQPDAVKGFILDGFPRMMAQKEAFDPVIAFSHVVVLDITDELAIERMTGRLICSGCGKIFHERWNPPPAKGKCDRCGGVPKPRDDDKPDLMRERLCVYHTETEPAIRAFESDGTAHHIDASATIPVIHAKILAALGILE